MYRYIALLLDLSIILAGAALLAPLLRTFSVRYSLGWDAVRD